MVVLVFDIADGGGGNIFNALGCGVVKSKKCSHFYSALFSLILYKTSDSIFY